MHDDEQKRVFSNNLNVLLRERKKTQVEVAAAIGVSPQTFNTWVQGVAIPRMGKIQLLADYFNVSKSVLIDPAATSSPAAAPSLSPDRIDLLEKYDVLNDEGKAEAVRYIGMLGSVPTYTEEHADTKLNA